MSASQDITHSNSLVDLAARIKAGHASVDSALKESVAHAIKAGELLVEAKALLRHGQWLPWLTANCSLSERSAQLYMRIAKNCEQIEMQIRSGVADLSLNQAAALLVMTSDIKKLLAFMREIESASPEEIVGICVERGVAVIRDDAYDPFHGRDEELQRRWLIFVLFLHLRLGRTAEGSWAHVEWALQGSEKLWPSPADWLGEAGAQWCKRSGVPKPEGDALIPKWKKFLYTDRTIADVKQAIEQAVQS
jgi:hypothetical protein